MHITIEPNQTFSHATLNPRHLLTTSIAYVDADLQQTIKQALDSDDENAMSLLWHEDVFDALQELAPEYCIFTTHEGDGSLFLWQDYSRTCEECGEKDWQEDIIDAHYGGITTALCGTCYDKHIDPDDGRRRPYDQE